MQDINEINRLANQLAVEQAKEWALWYEKQKKGHDQVVSMLTHYANPESIFHLATPMCMPSFNDPRRAFHIFYEAMLPELLRCFHESGVAPSVAQDVMKGCFDFVKCEEPVERATLSSGLWSDWIFCDGARQQLGCRADRLVQREWFEGPLR